LARAGPGTYRVNLGPDERQLLRELPVQLLAAITDNRDDPSFRRLFPPAYEKDKEAEKGYRLLAGMELDDSRSYALQTLSKTADSMEISEEELETWLRALNDIRLWLGTVLDVSEDDVDDEPDDPPHVLYHVLTWLQDLAITVLSGED
jgi:hypothetical protein